MSGSRPAGARGSYWVGVSGLSVKPEVWVNGLSVSRPPAPSLYPLLQCALSFASSSAVSETVAVDILSSFFSVGTVQE